MQSVTADRMIEKALINYPGAKVNTAGTLLVWLEAFDRIDDAIMLEAFALTMKRCKYFPVIADIQESIDTIKAQKRVVREDTARLGVGKNYDSPMAAKIFDVIAKMDTKKFVAEMEVEKEVVNYARIKFPNISERLIKENYLEIRHAIDGSEKCRGCMWSFGQCDTQGFFPSMELNANGQIHVSMMACQKRRAV